MRNKLLILSLLLIFSMCITVKPQSKKVVDAASAPSIFQHMEESMKDSKAAVPATGKWFLNLKETGETCGAVFRKGKNMVAVFSPEGKKSGFALLMLSGGDIPMPAEPVEIKATLNQTDEKPATRKVLNIVTTIDQRGTKVGSIVFAVPTMKALLGGINDVHDFEIIIDNVSVIKIGWTGGHATRDKLQQCVDGTMARTSSEETGSNPGKTGNKEEAKPVSTTSQLSVFDLRLNEPFDIRECNYQPKDVEVAGTGRLQKTRKKVKMYEYTEKQPASEKCFQRTGPSYTVTPASNSPAAKTLPPVLPVTNGKVKLVYSDDLRPALPAGEDIWLGIENSTLSSVRFYFPQLKADETFQALSKKYGKASSKEDLNIQNKSGARKDYYKAVWNLPKVQITFLSLDTGVIGYDPAKGSAKGYDSMTGSVTIQYKALNTQPKDNNPL